MKHRVRKKKKRVLTLGAVILLIVISAGLLYFSVRLLIERPEQILKEYMSCITTKAYDKMYEMIDEEASGCGSREEFIERNSNIYEGIEAQNMRINITESKDNGKHLFYECTFDTAAGEIHFENEAYFVRRMLKYKLVWRDSLIFPQLNASDKVRISVKEAERGTITDRNGHVLAGKGVATSVGIVPMRMQNREETIGQLALLLDMDEKEIEDKLSAGWVKEDSFVPVKTITKISELDLMNAELMKGLLGEAEDQEKLLSIPGVMLTDTEIREYPQKDAAAHLVGYVQKVTAEDLKEHEGEGYHANSVIGRTGVESLFEKELKGRDGCEIYIVDSTGNKKAILAEIPVENGEDIKLTIDRDLQKILYEQFKEDKSCSVAMNPYTGEVLALVSTPSYDNNDFVMGMSEQLWASLNEDERRPLYNRFRQTWCPGSAFKPVIAAIGLTSGALNPLEDFGNVGLSWQKDSSWGNYYVTTLHDYEPVILENALIYSDNIYFAKAALKIGSDELVRSLKNLGFGARLPFEITMSQSQFSNTEAIESEVQLADSGYGQGQILINPLHLAALYTAFSNHGNVIQPRLLYQEQTEPVIWLTQAFPDEVVQEVLHGMEKVINHENGTGYGAHRDDMVLAGKTGTAEIKADKEDTSGTELGWLSIFTTEESLENPLLLVSMVEDVKEIGGSGYVVNKDKAVLDQYYPVYGE